MNILTCDSAPYTGTRIRLKKVRPGPAILQSGSDQEDLPNGPTPWAPPTEPTLLFEWDIPAYEPHHFHWVGSQVKIWDSFQNTPCHLDLKVAHLANMQRTGGILDEGRPYRAHLGVEVENDIDPDPEYNPHFGFVVATLNYKKSIQNLHLQFDLTKYSKALSMADSASIVLRWIQVHVSELPPVDVLPIPTTPPRIPTLPPPPPPPAPPPEIPPWKPID